SEGERDERVLVSGEQPGNMLKRGPPPPGDDAPSHTLASRVASLLRPPRAPVAPHSVAAAVGSAVAAFLGNGDSHAAMRLAATRRLQSLERWMGCFGLAEAHTALKSKTVSEAEISPVTRALGLLALASLGQGAAKAAAPDPQSSSSPYPVERWAADVLRSGSESGGRAAVPSESTPPSNLLLKQWLGLGFVTEADGQAAVQRQGAAAVWGAFNTSGRDDNGGGGGGRTGDGGGGDGGGTGCGAASNARSLLLWLVEALSAEPSRRDELLPLLAAAPPALWMHANGGVTCEAAERAAQLAARPKVAASLGGALALVLFARAATRSAVAAADPSVAAEAVRRAAQNVLAAAGVAEAAAAADFSVVGPLLRVLADVHPAARAEVVTWATGRLIATFAGADAGGGGAGRRAVAVLLSHVAGPSAARDASASAAMESVRRLLVAGALSGSVERGGSVALAVVVAALRCGQAAAPEQTALGEELGAALLSPTSPLADDPCGLLTAAREALVHGFHPTAVALLRRLRGVDGSSGYGGSSAIAQSDDAWALTAAMAALASAEAAYNAGGGGGGNNDGSSGSGGGGGGSGASSVNGGNDDDAVAHAVAARLLNEAADQLQTTRAARRRGFGSRGDGDDRASAFQLAYLRARADLVALLGACTATCQELLLCRRLMFPRATRREAALRRLPPEFGALAGRFRRLAQACVGLGPQSLGHLRAAERLCRCLYIAAAVLLGGRDPDAAREALLTPAERALARPAIVGSSASTTPQGTTGAGREGAKKGTALPTLPTSPQRRWKAWLQSLPPPHPDQPPLERFVAALAPRLSAAARVS
ncbi:unnamed protein product, partial [Phaeothamnion confervicola]